MAVHRLLPAFRSVGRAVVDTVVLLHGCDLPFAMAAIRKSFGAEGERSFSYLYLRT